MPPPLALPRSDQPLPLLSSPNRSSSSLANASRPPPERVPLARLELREEEDDAPLLLLWLPMALALPPLLLLLELLLWRGRLLDEKEEEQDDEDDNEEEEEEEGLRKFDPGDKNEDAPPDPGRL